MGKVHLEHGRQHDEQVEGAGHAARHLGGGVEPEDGEHDRLEVLEEVLDAGHLLQEDVELEAHLYPDGDGGMGLEPEGAVVEAWVGLDAVLELFLVEPVRQVEVGARHEGRGLDLALGHVLHPVVQVVVVARVVGADGAVGEAVLCQPELDDRDAVDVLVRGAGELQRPGEGGEGGEQEAGLPAEVGGVDADGVGEEGRAGREEAVRRAPHLAAAAWVGLRPVRLVPRLDLAKAGNVRHPRLHQ